MYTLYCRKGAGSAAIEAMLAHCCAEYKCIDLDRDAEGAFPGFLHAVNPRAEVPTLILPDDSIMTESAAILILLADIHPAVGLAPAVDDLLRPRYLRWMVYLATTVYMSDLRYYHPHKYTVDGEGAAEIKTRAAEGMVKEFAIYADALGQGPFILGEAMSATDLYAAMLVTWVPDMEALFARHPNLKTMCDGVAAVPAIARVWERNGMSAVTSSPSAG